MSKILFLDIDGVLCTLRSQYGFGERLIMEAWDITSCNMIRRLCAANGYQIVCSSVWRKNEITRYYFAVYGLIDYLHEDWRIPLGNQPPRGKKVREWLQEHPKVTDYIIIDDDQDFYKYQKKRFVYVKDSANGFGSDEFAKTDKLMGGNFHDYMLSRKNRDRRSFRHDEIVG